MKPNTFRILAALALGGLMTCVPIARAQDKPAPPAAGDSSTPKPPRGGGRGAGIQAIFDKLDLTADQKEKLKPIMADQREKMTALHDDTSLSQEDRRAKMKEIFGATDAKLKDILTADQYTKWQELRKQMRPGGPRGPGAGAPAKPDAKSN